MISLHLTPNISWPFCIPSICWHVVISSFLSAIRGKWLFRAIACDYRFISSIFSIVYDILRPFMRSIRIRYYDSGEKKIEEIGAIVSLNR